MFLLIYVYLEQLQELEKQGQRLTSLCRYTGLKKDNFYTHFGRLNNTEFENENVRIIKTEIKRGGK